MLRRTFIFLDHIGPATERRLWRSGIGTWEEYLEAEAVPGVGDARKKLHDRLLRRAAKALEKGDMRHLATLLPSRESWRYYAELGDGAAYLDIETTGLGRDSPITVVGVYDGKRCVSLVRGQGLSRTSIRDALKDRTMLVTFNGTGFDLPMIEHHFPGALPRVPHLDLRYAGGKLGLRGGLKKIERSLGLERKDDVKGMSGEDAVRLWHMWRRDGNRNALRLLVDYNLADVVNLKYLAKVICGRLEEMALEEG